MLVLALQFSRDRAARRRVRIETERLELTPGTPHAAGTAGRAHFPGDAATKQNARRWCDSLKTE
jgi:hypothetical protein